MRRRDLLSLTVLNPLTVLSLTTDQHCLSIKQVTKLHPAVTEGYTLLLLDHYQTLALQETKLAPALELRESFWRFWSPSSLFPDCVTLAVDLPSLSLLEACRTEWDKAWCTFREQMVIMAFRSESPGYQ